MWLLLVLIVVALVVIKFVRLSLYWTSKGIPYEPFYRYLYRLFYLQWRRVIAEVVLENRERYGLVFGTYRVLSPTLSVADVEIVKDVTIKQFHKFFKRWAEFSTGDALWDNTLTHLPYDEWKAVRTVMGHTFTTSKMRGMIMKLDRVAKRMTEKVEKDIGSNADLLLKDYARSYSMDSMMAIAFGLDLDCVNNPDHKAMVLASDLFKPNLGLIFTFLFPKLARLLPFIHFPPKETSNYFGELGKRVLEEKRRKLDEVIKNNTADIIDLHLIAAREEGNTVLTDHILASQAFMFMIGGLDSTAGTVTFTMYYLTVHPHAQERIYEELCEIMGDRTEVQYDDVARLKYTEACILEALRITPNGGAIDRICVEPTEVAGIPIEKGMIVEFPAEVLHKNPEYFPEPHTFRPERFLQGEGASQQVLEAFITFGEGPKGCVGKRLALMNMQVLLANILLKFKLEMCDATPAFPPKLKKGLQIFDLTKDPFIVRFTKR